jgi:hypothetical protein
MASGWFQWATGRPNTAGIEFWKEPDRCGWLSKQGEQMSQRVTGSCIHSQHTSCQGVHLTIPVFSACHAGEYIKTWRRRSVVNCSCSTSVCWRWQGSRQLPTMCTPRWFVLKQGKIFWFKDQDLTPETVPRGVIDVRAELACGRCRVAWVVQQAGSNVGATHCRPGAFHQYNKSTRGCSTLMLHRAAMLVKPPC